MEIEYSNEVKGKVYAYRFSEWEKCAIAASLLPFVRKLERKKEKIKNHPKNEGQATYCEQVREIQAEINSLNEIIEEFVKSEATI